MNFDFLQQALVITSAFAGLIIVIASFILWIGKSQFKKGEFYQIFKNLVKEVKYIREMVEDKFIDNDVKHRKHNDQFQKHDKRLIKLEVRSDVKKQR